MTEQTQPTVRFINPPTIAAPRGYTHVVAATGGQTVYVSGQVAFDATGQIVGPGDMHAQARQALENVRLAVQSVGGDLSNVVKLTTFVTDMATGIMAFRAARDALITGNPPASTLVEVSRLAREEFLIEIEAIAVVAPMPGQ